VEVYDEEPDVGLFAGLMLWLMRVLPLEGLL
jgi:hypothetical protein